MSIVRHRASVVVGVALGVLALVGYFSVAQDAKGVRRIPIPHREHGYGNFKSQVLNTQEQFDAFLKMVEKQSGWNNRAAFLEAMQKAKLDFASEALVLVRQTEGSGSNVVTFAPSELKGDKLVCTIERKVAEIGTADLADYCLALAVPKQQVAQVEVVVDKKQREVLKLAPK